jgi:hypothetical protein
MALTDATAPAPTGAVALTTAQPATELSDRELLERVDARLGLILELLEQLAGVATQVGAMFEGGGAGGLLGMLGLGGRRGG